MNSSDTSDAIRFFNLLFGKMPDGAWLNLWRKAGLQSDWFQDIDLAAEWANGKMNTYVGMAMVKQSGGPHDRIKSKDAGALPGLWADLDVFGQAHTEDNLLPDLDAALALLDDLPRKPTLIVDSGHGLQAYWLFEEPWIFKTLDERDLARRTLRGWLAEIRKHTPHQVDSVGDLARVLRIPGTINHKEDKGCDKVFVTILKDDGPRYAGPECFTEYAEAEATETADIPERGMSEVLQEAQRAEYALSCLSPAYHDEYESWIGVGFSLCELGSVGLNLWENWSQRSDSYIPGDCASRWTGFTPGEGKTLASLFRWAKESDPKRWSKRVRRKSSAPSGELSINSGDRDLDGVAELAWDAIAKCNDPQRIFRHGSGPVRFEADGYVASLIDLTVDRLRYEAARSARWYANRKVDGIFEEVQSKPPLDVVRNMLARPVNEMPLPVVDRIVSSPILAENGELQGDQGYHKRGRVIISLDPGLAVPEIPENPTDADLSAAVALIDDLICDFPLVTASDRANAYALLLGPLVRDMIVGPTPLHLVEAAMAGSGKGLLVSALLTPSLGNNVGVLPAGRDDAEWRKGITSSLKAGRPAIIIDNVRKAIASPTLASALTATVWSDRVLGVNEEVNLPVRCIWIATGNNPPLSTEIARRSVRIRLDPMVDRPWQREASGFRHPELLSYAIEHRSELLGAALTIARAWVSAGQPTTNTPPLGSYEQWSRVIGGILAHAGIEGFLKNLDELYERADTEGTVWRQLVLDWLNAFGSRPVGVIDLYPIAISIDGFPLGYGKLRSRKTKLGQGLKEKEDVVFDGYRIEKAGKAHNAVQYRLRSISPSPEVSKVSEVTISDDQHASNTSQKGNLTNITNPPHRQQKKNILIRGAMGRVPQDREVTLSKGSNGTNAAPDPVEKHKIHVVFGEDYE